MASLPEKDRLLRECEVAEMLAITTRALQGWRFRGEGLPYRRIGRCIRYSLRDVMAFAEASRVVPGEKGGD